MVSHPLRDYLGMKWIEVIGMASRSQPRGVRYEQETVDAQRVPRRLAKLRREIFGVQFASSIPVMARHGSWVVLAMDGRRVVGYAWITPGVCRDKECLVDEVGVVGSHRGAGIGTRLVREAAAWMMGRGFESATIATFPGQRPWFSSLGFEQRDMARCYSAPLARLLADHADRKALPPTHPPGPP